MARGKWVWTDAKDKRLVELQAGGAKLPELARSLGRSVTWIRQRLKALGIDTAPLRWSDEQRSTAARMRAEGKSREEIGAAIGKTADAVLCEQRRLERRSRERTPPPLPAELRAPELLIAFDAITSSELAVALGHAPTDSYFARGTMIPKDIAMRVCPRLVGPDNRLRPAMPGKGTVFRDPVRPPTVNPSGEAEPPEPPSVTLVGSPPTPHCSMLAAAMLDCMKRGRDWASSKDLVDHGVLMRATKEYCDLPKYVENVRSDQGSNRHVVDGLWTFISDLAEKRRKIMEVA